MPDSIAVLPPHVPILDASGDPINGARLEFYAAGTTTPRTVYSNSDLTTALGSVVYCNDGGFPVSASGSSTRVVIYTGASAYKIIVKDQLGATVATYDNVRGALDTSAFASGGGLATEPVIQITASRAQLAADAGKCILVNAASGNVVYSLLDSGTFGDGKRVRIRKTSSGGTVSIVAAGSELIDGPTGNSATLQLTNYADEYLLRSTTAGWVASSNYFVRAGQITPDMLSAAISGTFVQTGSIIIWPDNATTPSGYLDCNGAAVSRTTYAALFAIVGTKYGTGDGSTTFNLPNYNRMFLRGWSASGTPLVDDPDKTARTDRGDGTGGNVIGSWQADALEGHTHGPGTLAGTTNTTGAHTHSYTAPNQSNTMASGGADTLRGTLSGTTGSAGDHSHTVTLGSGASASTGGNETRPNNVYVRFLIFTGAASATALNFHTILNGSGAPDNALGSNDDYYIDNTNSRLYGPKTAGAWGGFVSLIGPVGPNPGLDYAWNTATSGDPGSGKVLVNNATLASATALHISETNRLAASQATYIATWDDSTSAVKGVVRILDVNAPGANFAEFQITGSMTDAGGYDTFPVTYVGGAGTLANNAVIAVAFFATGAKGDTGSTGETGNTGLTGNTGATGAAAPFSFDYTWTTATTAPAAGAVGVNNATVASLTAMVINETNRLGSNLLAILSTLDDSTSTVKARIDVVDVLDATKWLSFTLTGALTDNGAWLSFPASYVGAGSALTDGNRVSVIATPYGNRGSDGAGTGDVVGPASSVDNELALYDSTTGKLIKRATTTGILKAASGVLSAAVAGTDFQSPIGTISGLAKGNGVNALTAATVGTDYLAPPSGTAVLKANSGGALANAAATDLGAGKHAFFFPAASMTARTTNGAARGSVETTTNKIMLSTLDFDTTTQEFVQFQVRMPKSWNEGAVTASFTLSHASTTTNFGMVFAIEAVAISDGDAGDAAFGTAQQVVKTGGTTNMLYITAETPAMTIGGTPAAEDWVVFQVKRVPADASDTMAIDARLHGVTLYLTTDAITDA
jgi:microcystin-dependent protein